MKPVIINVWWAFEIVSDHDIIMTFSKDYVRHNMEQSRIDHPLTLIRRHSFKRHSF